GAGGDGGGAGDGGRSDRGGNGGRDAGRDGDSDDGPGRGAGTPDAGAVIDPPPLTGHAFVFAAGAEFGGAQVTTFGFDLVTGALSRKGGTSAGPSPDYVAV